MVSLWEKTRSFNKLLSSLLDSHDIMSVRSNLVLLFIMNSNYYFPKLRSMGGVDKVFDTYVSLLKSWQQKNNEEIIINNNHSSIKLINSENN